MPLIEVCVETLPEAIQAAEAGASRLEVCACMSESGTTPSTGLVSAIIERLKIPAFVMIRPRGGDFVYDESEVDVMLRDIDAMKRVGAHGIVSGALESSGQIDCEVTKALREAAAPLPFTFHRAFDLAPELESALEELKKLGVNRVLTSGGASSAIVGADAIARLQRRGGSAVTMLAGGGVRAPHAVELVRASGVNEVHARPTRRRPALSTTPRDIRFGSNTLVSTRTELDPEAVRALVQALASIDEE
jgi:copper homeostasis protein